MKKIRVTAQLGYRCSVGEFIRDLSYITCNPRIYFTLDGMVVVNIDDDQIDEVIEKIDEYYAVYNVEVVDMDETSSTSGRSDESSSEAVDATSDDSTIVNKVTFENREIEEVLNKLLKSILWALNFRCASPNDINACLFSTIGLLSMKYSSRYPPQCSIGDIVVVNYGNNLRGETGGAYVHGIVCDIPDDERIFVIPIGKITKQLSNWNIPFSAPKDVTYYYDGYEGGLAILEQARYINKERINDRAIRKVVGKVSHEFLSKLLELLPKVFTFSKQDDETEDQNDVTSEQNADILENVDDEAKETTENGADSEADVSDLATETTTDDAAPPEVAIDGTAEETTGNDANIDNESSHPKMNYHERILYENIGEALNSVNNSGVMADEIRRFMKKIGMDETDGLLLQAFSIACEIEKITVANISLELVKIAGLKKSKVDSALRDSFKQWLEQYPNVKRKCPKISLAGILKAFSEKMNS